MTNFKVDLTNCDKEPIHILGKVQAHGFLAAINNKTSLITYVSENILLYTGVEAKSYLGKELFFLEKQLKLTDAGISLISNQLIKIGSNSKNFENINPIVFELDSKPFNLIITASDNETLLEFEPAGTDEFDPQTIIGKSLSQILAGTTLSSMLERAASVVKKIINYDRVMIYQFGEDDHGQVIAEEKNEDLTPFLGLYYPASDIPKQARQLYILNLTRIIADVSSEPSPILTDGDNHIPLNLTHSELRAVSPVHIQYLKNMGVLASFSISLISKGALWGLIACHNYTPKFINYKARDSAKLIAQILSAALEYRQGDEDAEKFSMLSQTGVELISMIDKGGPLIEAITKPDRNIKDITNATGVSILFEDRITSIGVTPDNDQLKDIAAWIFRNCRDSVYYSHRFPTHYKAAEAFSEKASGVIACILSRELKEIVIWFKPEQVQIMNWAGNPDKPVEVTSDGLSKLSPRLSFASWTQVVKNTSDKWNRAEIATVINIREHLIYAIKRRANEIRALNEQLVLAYEELDAFSYTVTHDLKTPLSSIKSYAEWLLTTNDNLDSNAKDILQRINKCTDKMAVLIKGIFNYSRIGREGIAMVDNDMTIMLGDLKIETLQSCSDSGMQFQLGDTPSVFGDTIMINQVFSNLISNAIKYSSKRSPQVIKVEGNISDGETVYTVHDNGIGIDINYHSRVFELFKRLDNVENIEGTGVGLAIVKKIMEKHDGRIWFESILNEGTIFHIAFKNKQ